MTKHFYILLLSLLFVANYGFAQKKCDVTIDFSPSFCPENVAVFVDGGYRLYQPRIDKRTFPLHLSQEFKSTYAAIVIGYPRKDGKKPDHKMGFFVSDEPAEISFLKNYSSENKLGRYEVKNAVPFEKMGAGAYNDFIREETLAFWDSYNKNDSNSKNNNAIAEELKKKKEELTNKSIEFIVNHGDLYYSFWAFRTKITPTESIDYDSLRELYYSVFPENFRTTFEGKTIESKLKQEKIRSNMDAPDFTTNDIHGNPVTLGQFKGKYLLVNFWASWCAPCIGEFPAIRDIYNKYRDKELEFVFINSDKDSLKFRKAIDRYDLSYGLHIARNMTINDDYGVGHIPRLFLISPDGMVLYTRHQAKDDEVLGKLKSLLSELIGDREF